MNKDILGEKSNILKFTIRRLIHEKENFINGYRCVYADFNDADDGFRSRGNTIP